MAQARFLDRLAVRRELALVVRAALAGEVVRVVVVEALREGSGLRAAWYLCAPSAERFPIENIKDFALFSDFGRFLVIFDVFLLKTLRI